MTEWERILWKTQPFPDNHIPVESFLISLRRNPNFRPYTYWPLVLLSCAITQHLATIFGFLALFVRLKEHTLDPRALVWTSICCFGIGFLTWEFLRLPDVDTLLIHANRVKAFKSSILIFLALMSLAPVLRTLTAATSSDSIWALTAFLFALNALLADYSAIRPYQQSHERLTSVLSMNAAISASVVLASRLADDLAVFALILFSVQTFALFPLLRRRLQSSHVVIQAFITLCLSGFAIIPNIALSGLVACMYAAVLFSVTFVGPAVLVWAQKYKNEIRGPWDVAVPKVN